jgi:CheY-like chemotaxis protein
MKNILIVDDDDSIRDFIKALLEEESYKVAEASGGKDALKILDKKKFDLILLDFFMPEMSGREVAEKIRENQKTKNNKIALLTVAEFGNEGLKNVKRLKILDYIKKPIDNKDFLRRVKKMTGK